MRNNTFNKLRNITEELKMLNSDQAKITIPSLTTSEITLYNKKTLLLKVIPKIEEIMDIFIKESENNKYIDERSHIREEYEKYIDLISMPSFSEYKILSDKLTLLKEERISNIRLSRDDIENIVKVYDVFGRDQKNTNNLLKSLIQIDDTNIYDFNRILEYLKR